MGAKRYRCTAHLWAFADWYLTGVSHLRYICIVNNANLTPEAIREALAHNAGNIAATSRELGVSRATLYRWMKAHAIGIERIVKAA